jgi:hypothetical protein
MSRFSEKRLAADLAKAVTSTEPNRRRRDMAVILFTLCGGLIGNFVFNRIEVAGVLWTVSLAALADWLLSWGKLATIRGVKRVLCDTAIVAVVWWPTYPIAGSQYRQQHAALLSGTLRAHGKPTLSVPSLQVGNGGTLFAWTGKSGQPMMASVNKPTDAISDKITIERGNNGEVLFSTTIRDSANNLIVEIVKNHWRIGDAKTSCWDKNYTDDMLEVKDGTGRVVLQVRLLPDVVQLQAEWPGRDSSLTEAGKYTKGNGITPVFKYPSEEHWGELDSQSGYGYAAPSTTD